MRRTRRPFVTNNRRPYLTTQRYADDDFFGVARPNCIIPRLYQGGYTEPETLKALGITAIINMDHAPDDLPQSRPVKYLWHPIADGLLPDVRKLHEVADQGVAWLQAGETVFVHCAQGWNRSGLVNGLILILGGYVTCGTDAVKLIRDNRKNALGNSCFRDYLANYESDPEGRTVNPPRWLRTPRPVSNTITNALWQDDAEADLELSARWQRLLDKHGDSMLTE